MEGGRGRSCAVRPSMCGGPCDRQDEPRRRAVQAPGCDSGRRTSGNVVRAGYFVCVGRPREGPHPGSFLAPMAVPGISRGPSPWLVPRLSLSQNSLGEGPGALRAGWFGAGARAGTSRRSRTTLTLPLRGCPSPKTAWERDLGSLRSRLLRWQFRTSPCEPCPRRGRLALRPPHLRTGSAEAPRSRALAPPSNSAARVGHRDRAEVAGAKRPKSLPQSVLGEGQARNEPGRGPLRASPITLHPSPKPRAVPRRNHDR